jgi:phage FluMu protein Com
MNPTQRKLMIEGCKEMVKYSEELKKRKEKTHKCPKCKAVNVCESGGTEHACRSCPNIWSEK